MSITKMTPKQIYRVRSIEKEYGIDDLKIYAYIDGGSLVVVGEIIAEKLLDTFKLVCSIYDQEGDMIESIKNEPYGSGVVTSEIYPRAFFDRYPFLFRTYLGNKVKIGKIRVTPE